MKEVNKAVEEYISKVLDREFEFITENQVIPVVVEDKPCYKPYCLLDNRAFPEEGVCDVNKLREVLLCNLGDDSLKIDYDGTLKIIRNTKELARAIRDTGKNRNSLLVNLKGSFGIHSLFFHDTHNEKLIPDLLLHSEFLDDDLDILNVSFSYLDYIERVYSIFLKAMSTRHFEFMSNNGLIPIIVTNNMGHSKEWTVHISNDTMITSDISCLKSDIISGIRSINEDFEFIDIDKITDFIDKSYELLKSTNEIDNIDYYVVETEKHGKIHVKRNRIALVKKLLMLYVKGIKVLGVY